jgi:hypothetical protein
MTRNNLERNDSIPKSLWCSSVKNEGEIKVSWPEKVIMYLHNSAAVNTTELTIIKKIINISAIVCLHYIYSLVSRKIWKIIRVCQQTNRVSLSVPKEKRHIPCRFISRMNVCEFVLRFLKLEINVPLWLLEISCTERWKFSVLRETQLLPYSGCGWWRQEIEKRSSGKQTRRESSMPLCNTIYLDLPYKRECICDHPVYAAKLTFSSCKTQIYSCELYHNIALVYQSI